MFSDARFRKQQRTVSSNIPEAFAIDKLLISEGKVDNLAGQSANPRCIGAAPQFHRRPLIRPDKRDSGNEHPIAGAINFNRFQFEASWFTADRRASIFQAPLIFVRRSPWIQGPFLKVITRCARPIVPRLFAIPNRSNAH